MAELDLRIDYYPTHEHKGIKYRRGHVLPFGATMVPNGVNFSVYSSASTSCTLVMFERGEASPFAEIPFPDEFKIGNVYCMIVFDLDFENLEYGYRMDGPYDPANGHRFNKDTILSDPYAKAIGGRDTWLALPNKDEMYSFRSRLVFEDFDWEYDRPLQIPIEDLVIYEMHVRSFTMHPTSGAKYKGTFAGIREKIPYLKELGINCIELMPIYEFDEWEHSKLHPETGEQLVNYWGYSTLNFFSPKAGYAASGRLGMQVDELKTLIKDLHSNGIEVFLDVVFNHTAEGDHRGPAISFKGIDNKTYYMLTPEGYYFNFSGTGNTLNCNNPVVRNMVLDCLRYWASEYHIDGFRFDLAAILGRAPDGSPLNNPPLLESLAFDPVLANCKLIAEAWDAGGLYQVGNFPAYGRWAEWNGKYRDNVRKYLKGDAAMVGHLAQAIQGSPWMYPTRGTTAGINFITCHDGLTLYDLFAYNTKHNYANGEDNNDGCSNNESWNCGYEGETVIEEVIALRHRQMKNALTILLVSQGVPMIYMGDEMGRTQHGNNNAYCHDNDINWLNWELKNENADLFVFAKHVIAFRKAHPVLRNRNHFTHTDYMHTGFADITFHGVKPFQCDFSADSRVFACMLNGQYAKNGTCLDDYIYIATNSSCEAFKLELPLLSNGMCWHTSVNTGIVDAPCHFDIGNEPVIQNTVQYVLGPRSVIVLLGKLKNTNPL
ncbi:glycogen debranching protein GlgX [Mucilaginibacter aquatilis]|uniref:Glycogen debranching protein GlgX n=1 Tax=Mucilaginibacter aquatilis TaxID=1517760 RepID=A0A6I4I853_9SPHI|nr:glycogen debranching protein GlgX [Mucilaginibacter aquatilis]MVN91232.1 glycogen debranching protein GlgX [Mucilaginibacter aquatilis]